MKRRVAASRLACLLLGVSLASVPLHAATFVVDTPNDGADMTPGDGICRAAGPAPRCTLRAAIQEANALAGADVINFSIGTGLATISPGSALPTISTRVTIDGTTQPGFVGTPIIELDGISAGGGVHGLTIAFAGSSLSVIRGLVIDRFSGIAIRILAGSANNVIAGNFLGTDPTGTLTGRGNSVGVYIQAATNNVIGGTTAADRNIISGNNVDGIQIDGAGTSGNLVQGNYIGLDVTGTADLGNTFQGVAIFGGAPNNTIGGTAVGARNVISGNNNIGITISVAGATGNRVEGNFIGTNAAGTAGIGNFRAIDIGASASGNFIGGTAAGAPNRIAYNTQTAISLQAAAGASNLISSNEIYSNGTGLGIDLSFNGVTSNDVGDVDGGANNLQNFPVLSAATTNGAGMVNFAGSLNSAASTSYRIEFFASSAADPSGFGEGERYLGFTNVTTNASGNAIIGVTLAMSLTAGEVVTATATDPSNNTSEFSNAIVAVGSLVVTTTADTVDGTTTSVSNLIADPGGDGRISLREAILAANATGGADTIRFGIPLTDANHLYYRNDSIPGSLSLVVATPRPEVNIADFDPDYPAGLPRSWYRIQPGSVLPSINGPLVIDGTSQPGWLVNGPVVELVGASAGATTYCFAVSGLAPSSSIRGLIINQWGGEAVTSSGTSLIVQGNYLGTDPSGTLAQGNGTSGFSAAVYLGGNGSQIGGLTLADRNVISGNQSDGIWIDADSVLIRGNHIGTNVTGSASLGNAKTGIVLTNVGNPTVSAVAIGGTAIGSRNVISGNGIHGILLDGATCQNNSIQGNFIGTDFMGATALGNGSSGVAFNGGASNNLVGGTAALEANRIAFNTGRGILFDASAGTGNTLLGNLIHSNGSLGIDLSANGVTPNDAGDVDVGPNSLLNFPFDAAALESAGTLTVHFKLDLPAGWYRVEFFKNPLGADLSGNGEGELFAGSTNVNHPGGGTAPFSHALAGAVGDIITTTTTFCTDGATCAAFSDTSEFGKAFTAVPTAVKLLSFTAVGLDEAVEVSWKTGSELNNLGFHLSRSRSSSGPFERITAEVIPGLGSSPAGATYRHRDSGLENGLTYFYKLEDIEATGKATQHGPVSATPEGREDGRETHGNPTEVWLRVLERDGNGALIELETGGFFATPSGDGTFRLEVPGFAELGSPSLPVKRTWLEAVAGRGVRIAKVEAFEVTSIPGLTPSSALTSEIVASPDGTVRAGVRRARGAFRGSGVFPATASRIVETGFQEELKKALLELAPLRWDSDAQQLLWARRLRVRVSFAGVESRDRHREVRSHRSRRARVQISTSRAGLYRVPRSRAFPTGSLRLSRLGEPVPYHLEPKALYFVGEENAVYELESGPGGITMPVDNAPPSGVAVSSYQKRSEWEEDRFYQAGLLEAPSLWLWDLVMSRSSRSYPFTLGSLLDGDAKLEVSLQGASDFEAAPDHHVRIWVNGSVVGEASWDGKAARTVEVSLPPGALREGANELSIENLGDTEAQYSMVFLDRFALTYRRPPVAEEGILEGLFTESGTVKGEGSLVIQTSPETRWLLGTDSGSFRVEAGRSYLAVSPEAVLDARLRTPPASSLRSTRNRADYLLIAPREFLSAAEPLLQHRRSQRLSSRAVAIEEIYDEFGYGEARPEAVKEFLEYAYHHWQKPSLRYVVLLGDATYDPEDNLRTGVVNRVPALMRKTSYLWTASDPTYASVNGEDGLPDVALGRLPAATVEEVRVLVTKVLEYEESGQDLSGPAVLVADNPDAAGDFEADSNDIASRLTGREVEKLYLSLLGPAETRSAIVDSLDRGASLLSYVGHGGIALWASENLFETADVSRLRLQERKPIVMTMNCLNGYFHFPYFDSLAEALVKAEGKGAIAAFSPSGLSLNGPAHLYHQALVDELASSRHTRLGDAVLAAQTTYAESGVFPELLAIYHLFGDPALQLR